MLLATALLFALQSAPDARAAAPVSTGTAVSAAPAVQTSTRTAPSGPPASEFQVLKESVRQDQNAIRRARYALQRARQRADAGAAAQAEKRLQEAKESLKRHRIRMRELLWPKPKPGAAEKPRG
ncbi:MAG: hypothetical protein A2X36_06585 [Elusimicrobia bacterium GWA2_69_24]|nr:MAG: hypothetical protein A2X36_06585 [Elusimicrobia bacterium GWA2_69_24]HBL17960.1 hypothetical protein [Elusimicrobiota bacterium]